MTCLADILTPVQRAALGRPEHQVPLEAVLDAIDRALDGGAR